MAVATLALALCAVLGPVAPAAAATGSITGTVTEAGSGDPIGGVLVCTSTRTFGIYGGCDGTDSNGDYRIEGLQPSYYQVAFAEEQSGNYLAQWYPGKPTREEAGAVEVKSGEEATADAVLEVGGQIAGRVTDVSSGAPIEGIEICTRRVDAPVEQGGVIHCDDSDADGNYLVWAMPSGQYTVEFGPQIFSRGAPNYIRQYYPGKPRWNEAEVRGVTAGTTVSGIDAALQRGIGVEGIVTEVGGAPVHTGNTRVCALDAVSEEIVTCTGLEMDGSYWMPGLPFGSYRVSFSVDVEEDGLVLHPDEFVRQYYNGKPTFAAADVLGSAGPTVFSGIDARLVRGPEVFPPKPVSPQPGLVPISSPRPSPPPLRCRKHFRKKLVRGKRRCVKIQKKRHRHRGGHARGRGDSHR